MKNINRNILYFFLFLFIILPQIIYAGANQIIPIESQKLIDSPFPDSLDIDTTYYLDEFIITKKQNSRRKINDSATNLELMTKAELNRAACCNLGESFINNASVDVNYSDAATGAKQIKLLGLSGSYVQMLTENIPNLRGAAAPYGLGYIPGTWMESIQVSKGANSVKNGYESVTGQINVEFLKPQRDQSVLANAYVDIFGKGEINAAGNIHLNKKWSTGLLLHAENAFASHDENNDGFIDLPLIKQFSGMNRWAFFSNKYIFQAGLKFLIEERESGQHFHHKQEGGSTMNELYKIDIDTRRWEFFAKNAYIIDSENENNIALILSATNHSEDADYGHKLYNVDQNNLYASLIYERNWKEGLHAISTGLSYNYDYFNQKYRLVNNLTINPALKKENESTPGIYAQYTFNLDRKLIIMGGLRYDYSSIYGSMVTPRFHVRSNLFDGILSIFASVGRGYRSPHPLADNHFYMASSRKIIIGSNLRQEVAINYGGGASAYITLFDRTLNINAEFYYTRFIHQMLVDLDTDPHSVIISDSENKPNFSRVFQIEVSYPIIPDLSFSATYRLADVKVDFGKGLVSKPLTSKHKGLFTFNYQPFMGLWQFDLTLAINGGGRMPDPYRLEDGSWSWNKTYKAFPQLNFQVTRNFKNWAVYVGGENLTNYKQKNPIIDSANPWGDSFDATMVYAPIHGAMIYAGFRYNFTKY